MGMNAQLFAIGRYNSDLKRDLDYPSHYYNDLKEDVIIMTEFVRCNTSDQSYQLSNALGIDPWDFNKHFIPNKKAKEISIEALDLNFTGGSLCEKFDTFVKYGFSFIYIPNG